MKTYRDSLLFFINGDSFITLSLLLFIFLYNLPVTLLIPEIIRKPLLMMGLLLFVIGTVITNVKYTVGFITGAVVETVFFYLTWTTKLSLGSYMFPALVSMEFLICSILLLDKRIIIPRRVISIFVIVTFITSVTTSLGLLKYPTAIRTLGQVADSYNSYWQNLYRTQNIAGWGLLFGMAFSSGILLYLYRREKNIIFLIVLCTDVLCVLMSQLMFAILLMGLVLVLVFINGNSRTIALRTIPLFFTVVFVWFERSYILMWLYNLLKNTEMKMLALRVQNLYDLLVLKSTEGDAGSRFELYSMSLNSFVTHPFGRFFVGTDKVPQEIGFHSEFCDFIGALGILGLIVILALFIVMLKRVSSIESIVDKRFYLTMVVVFTIMFIINPVIAYPQIWMSTLLIPLIAINEKEERESNTVSNIALDFEP